MKDNFSIPIISWPIYRQGSQLEVVTKFKICLHDIFPSSVRPMVQFTTARKKAAYI